MILIYVLALLLTILCGFILLWAFLALRNHRRFSYLPGPPVDSLFLGNLPALAKYLRVGKCESEYFYDRHMEFGFTFKIFALYDPIIVTCDPLTVRDLKLHNPKDRAGTER